MWTAYLGSGRLWRCEANSLRKFEPLQLGVLGFDLLIDGDVGISLASSSRSEVVDHPHVAVPDLGRESQVLTVG